MWFFRKEIADYKKKVSHYYSSNSNRNSSIPPIIEIDGQSAIDRLDSANKSFIKSIAFGIIAITFASLYDPGMGVRMFWFVILLPSIIAGYTWTRPTFHDNYLLTEISNKTQYRNLYAWSSWIVGIGYILAR